MLANSLNKGFRGGLTAILLLYLVVFTASVFIKNASENYYYPNIFYNYIASFATSEWLVFILNHLLLIIGVILVAFIVSEEEIVDKLNYFPVFIFLLISAMVLGTDRISPFLLSNIVILYSVYKILNIYRQDYALSNVFNACFWLSVTVYLNVVNIFTFPFMFVSLLILRPFNWREFVIALMGFAAPIFIYECLSYLFNFNQWYLFESLNELFLSFKIPTLHVFFIPFLSCIVFLFLLSVLGMISNGFGNTVKKQKAKSCFIWYLILVSPSIFTSGVNYANVLLFFSIPLSFIIGDFLFGIKNIKLTNFLLLMCILSSLLYLIYKTNVFQ